MVSLGSFQDFEGLIYMNFERDTRATDLDTHPCIFLCYYYAVQTVGEA